MKRLCLVAALVLLPRFASAAEPSPEEVERARTFFDAGAQAYAAEKYADAVRSFEQARQIVPKPPIVFSLAQAERKLYGKTGDARTLASAIAHYREYIALVPKGGRRADALEAKDELEAKLAKVEPQQAAVPAAPAEKKKPRVTVISSTPGARATFDGGAPQELPLFVDLEPGPHTVRVFAEGFVDDVEQVSGDKLVDVPLNLPLREKPARLEVVLAQKGDLYVDGRLVATTPVGTPVEVAPGIHVVSVGVNGRRAWSQEITFVRDRVVRIEPRLQRSDQRLASYVVLGGGGVVTLAGLFAGIGALDAEKRAQRILDERAATNITEDQRVSYNNAIDKRDTLRTTSIVSLSVGGALLAAGALLYVFDRPSFAVVPPRPQEQPKPTKPSLELTASPVLAPGTWGGAVLGTF